MKIFFAISFFLLNLNLSAQLLDGIDALHSRAEILRGSLRPERTCFDVNYYDLNIELDVENKEISGSNKMYFTSVESFKKLQIDLFDNMLLDKIVFKGKNLAFEREFNAVFVNFPYEIKKNSQQMIEMFYHGKPIIAKNAPWDGGFSWKKDKENNHWIAVSCEGIGASLWWPNKDHLSDEPDSMRVSCTIPKDLTFVGNGVLEKDIIKGTKRTMTWKISYPINNYNVTLNIGKYINFQNEYISRIDSEKLILDYWVMPYNLDKAKKQFQQVKPMLEAQEKYFGKFPFWKDNYKLVETPYLGMEHQTAIAYGNNYKKGYAGSDYSRIGLDFDYIIIHESGHEYWGNLVSVDDMADLWIHEGFCTYSEALYVEHLYGYQKAMEYINAKKPTIGNKKPILGEYGYNNEGDGDMYNKGMLFLNTLRHIIDNDTLWFEILMEMTTEKFAYKTINTNDVVRFFNKKTNMDLTNVFMQYLGNADIPVLYYSVKKAKGNMYSLSYKWLTDVKDFKMPVILKIAKKEYKLVGTNKIKTFDFKKKKKQKINFDEDKFYFKKLKASF